MDLILTSRSKRQVVDISALIENELSGSGVVHLFLAHTTAALALADLDPGSDEDLLNALELMTPKENWKHPHNPRHFPDHLWSTLIGPSLSIPFHNSQLILGAWQRVVLVELDGPRERHLVISTLKTD